MTSRKSKVPKRTYSSTLAEQQQELKSDGLMSRFAASRRQLSSDRYRPLYHYVNPEGNLNDPNGLCYWQGRYHLFYQAYPPEDPRQHWGHAVSDDLVHWSDLPLAVYPDPEEACYSGSTLVEDDRVIAIYYGRGHGNIVAVSSDPLLLNWQKLPGPGIPMVEPDDDGLPYRVYDPCIWREDDGYYSLSGSYWKGEFFRDCRMVQHLFFSQDLSRWTYLGPLTEEDVFTGPGEDAAVPYFWPIGDKHILVFASHQRGAQYLLGDYDRVHHKFRPHDHGRFSFGSMKNGSIHAPSATPDGRGGIYVIYNMNRGRPTEGWSDIMSLPRILTLGEDGALRQAPVTALESLRNEHRSLGETAIPANDEIVLDGIQGSSLELDLEIDLQDAREVCLTVLRSPRSRRAHRGQVPQAGVHVDFDSRRENAAGRAGHRRHPVVASARRSRPAPGGRAIDTRRWRTAQAPSLRRPKLDRSLRQRQAVRGPPSLPLPRRQRRSLPPRPGQRGYPTLPGRLADEKHLGITAFGLPVGAGSRKSLLPFAGGKLGLRLYTR